MGTTNQMSDIQRFIEELGKEQEKNSEQLQLAVSLEELKAVAQKYEGEDKIISSLDIAEKIKNQPEEPKMLSGLKGLDDILKGFRAQQLVTISAPTKHGKTSFCIDLTSRLKPYNPMWLPFEEGAEELIRKFIERGEEPPLFYTPEHITGNTLLWVEKKIIEAIAKYNSRIVFIDHLHFIVEMTGSENMSLKIGHTMRQLKGLAKKWDVTIFLIAHLSKTRLEVSPDLNDLRDSSFIAQESDTVIIMWRETKREAGQVVITNNVNISVQANRRTGKTGNIKMVYEDGRFREQEWESSEEEKEKVARQFNNF